MISDRFCLVGWAAAGFALVAMAGLVANRHCALRSAHEQEARFEAQLHRAREETAVLAKARRTRKFACAPNEPQEETRFLTGLRRRARSAGVSIVRLGSHASTYEDRPAQGGPATGSDALLAGVTKAGADLVLDGSYAGFRRFLQGFSDADRLYTLSNVGWSRTAGGSELSLTLSRYLAPVLSEARTP